MAVSFVMPANLIGMDELAIEKVDHDLLRVVAADADNRPDAVLVEAADRAGANATGQNHLHTLLCEQAGYDAAPALFWYRQFPSPRDLRCAVVRLEHEERSGLTEVVTETVAADWKCNTHVAPQNQIEPSLYWLAGPIQRGPEAPV